MKCIHDLKTRNLMLIGISIVILLALIQMIVPVAAEESFTVFCYRDSRKLGNVVVFDVSSGATACNNLYYDCKGKCIGCFNDFDYVDYVCVDTSGRTFLR